MDRRSLLRGMGVGVAGVGLRRIGWAAAGGHEPDVPVAKIATGVVSGYWAASAGAVRVASFKGIPYGADTRGTRFQTPGKVAGWVGVRECREWGARAPQQTAERGRAAAVSAGFNAVPGAEVHYHLPPDEGVQSEDCLHLNVWTPALGRRGAKLPVLFYIHGGAYNNGTVNAAIYDGSRLAGRGDCVMVTVNHRLNAFGYLYLGEVAGGKYRESGNVGMLDLVLALEWVRENIAEFGGDKGRVTIFGQSGGGAKCATLMAMESAKGLFHRVWTMSGQQVWAVPREKAEANGKVALAGMGIGGEVTASALEGLTVEQIQAGARTTANWLPVRDDVVLKRDPFAPDAPAMSAGVPMVLGNTKDEIMGATAWRMVGLSWETLPEALGKELAPFKGPYSVEEIVAGYRKWYPRYKAVDVYVAAVAAFRSWPGQVIEAERRAVAAASAGKTWVYEMDWESPVADGRAPHTVDIAFVFDNLRVSPGVVGASEQEVAAAQPLATLMSGRLVEFAKTGVPGGGWPVYGLDKRETMVFDRVSRVVGDPRGEERRMMAGAGYRQPGT